MGQIVKINNESVKEALMDSTRQYFVGNLSRPQKLTFIKDDRLEIGISSYSEYQSEQTHRHNIATEYQYVISGWTEYMDVDTDEVYAFKKGDFYAIKTGTAYSQKVKAGTSILFIKVPSVNDKEVVEIREDQAEWLKEKLRTVRTDYYYQENSLKANSIKPAAAVAILNPQKEILMLHRRDNGKWTLPGGTLEYGESMTECALREVREESGLNVNITDIIGTYTDPNIKVAYSDGEVRQEFTIVYFGTVTDFNVTLDEESRQYRWVSLERIKELPLADSQRRRLEDVLAYLEKGHRHFT